ncbi:Alpha/Beta hydrolase protein [Stachybotrys elegans]|uniref:Alpha/Beta hydrolase protein n=1 Tax=Stachybotrys elegans TaxID=80388 RepID=A0A8K0T495_9HYPO|nr:Alpha/Beta hydrolase protein [Stachybotrys elegans]
MADKAAPAILFYTIQDFRFQNGTNASVKLAYLDINPQASKTALVITCFRGRLQSTLNYANGCLRDYRVIVVALFGNGESSSPSNTPDMPKSVDYRDCVRAQRQLLVRHLGITCVDVMLGFSMGGQCTYYWNVMHPEFARNAVIVCSSARTSRHNYQFLEGPKAALQNAIDYVDASQKPTQGPSRGLRAFGKAYSAWLTSAEWFEQEIYKTLGYETLAKWDVDVAGNNYSSWDPEDLLCKLQMWQHGDVTVVDESCEGKLDTALSKIQARVLLMPCQTDQYFRWEASEREVQWIPKAKLAVIPSIWGHLAGLGSNQADTEWMNKTIAEFLTDDLL